ncbi:outer membrane lipoprotein-sorting protein [Treponema pectinovorum]|uniref:outer membrane lipoprotein-sorting protein n=1 Tax=Treponema pectinovorum TaxID=164 RepID=UPI003D917257
MKKILSLIFTFAFVVAAISAQNLSGYDIVKKNDDLPSPKTSASTATLTIHTKKGDRLREVIMKTKDYGDVKKEVIVFTTPKDVAGVGYLMFNYEEKEDGSKKDSDNWLYMPAMKKVRRIASSGTESEGNFMGTDFTYQDMGDRSINKDVYTLLGEEAVDGVDCYKVECVSKTKTEKNPRRIVYIAKKDFVLRKAEYFDRQNQLHRILTTSGIKEIDGYMATTFMKMENVQSGTWSIIEIKNIVYNSTDIDDSLFTVASLEKGRIR